MRARNIAVAVCFILIIVSCVFFGALYSDRKSEEDEPLSITGFAFDTTYTITLHEGGSDSLLGECVRRCAEYENIFSRTKGDSELARMNEISAAYKQVVERNSELKKKWRVLKQGSHVSYTRSEKEDIEKKIFQCLQVVNSGSTEKDDNDILKDDVYSYEISQYDGKLSIPVSEDMHDLLQKGLYYSELSEGGFDITIEPVSSLWNFNSDSKKLPDSGQIKKMLDDIGYERVQLTKQQVFFLSPGIGIDLGGIAKGYIADCLKSFLVDNGVKSGIINLGGNVLCIGEKTDGDNFHIGIQQPFAERSETAMAVGVKDLSVVSSGVYERYFETDDGKIYHHILNPMTGYPYDNNIYGVTVISKNSVDGDGLSTTCFAFGLERGLKLIDSIEDTYAVFITDDGKLHYSEGFESMIYD